MNKILLDTDIGYGTDADDAVALAYLLLHPDCELLGVTTVGRRSDWRAAQAQLLLAEMGREDIPVEAGADEPLWANAYWPINPIRPWPDGHPRQPRRTCQPGRAVPFLAETIRRAPGEITLVAIGQFTNLARLLLYDPEAVGMLAGVVAMGGCMQYPPDAPAPECNVMLDPVAAGLALQRLGSNLTLLPLDPVRGQELSGEQVSQIAAGEDRTVLRTFCDGWKEHRRRDGVGLADPVTVALPLHPELAETVEARACVRLSHQQWPGREPFPGEETTGVTYLADADASPHHIVTAIDAARTHAHLMKILCGA